MHQDRTACLCGCGTPVNRPESRWLPGHNRRHGPVDYVVEDRGHDTPCWIWQRYLNAAGYGQKNAKGHASSLAHRVYYEQSVGPIPAGLELDHLCRVTACVNPAHLEPVTPLENMHRSRKLKLTTEDVNRIRALVASGRSRASVGREYGIDGKYIGQIVSGVRRARR